MSERSNSQTYYEVLEIQPNSGPTDIYNAYQRAKATYSPSSPAIYSMFSQEEAQQLLALIEEAYHCLSHQGRRKDYDVKIGLCEPKAPPRSTKNPTTYNYSQPASQPAQAAYKTAPTPVAAPSKKRESENWVGPVRVLQKREELPSGYARTKFSVYEVKPEIEKEIESIVDVDGQFLQKVRLYKGVKIEQMSDEIRVIKSTLIALENNDVDALPVAVFTRGFVVGISRALGLNEKKITDSYMKFFKAKKSER
jgi:curved DNA-binding protein CbpA